MSEEVLKLILDLVEREEAKAIFPDQEEKWEKVRKEVEEELRTHEVLGRCLD